MNIRVTLMAAALCAGATCAQAGSIIPIGSSLTFGGTNLPGACANTTCADAVTFSSTPVLIDGGALSLYETQTSTGPNGEWDVWHLSTVGGGPLAGNISGNWSIVMDYELSQAVDFDAVVDQFAVDGTPVNPLSNFGGICCASSSNPILAGEAFYNSGFSGPLNAGVQSNWQQIFIDPYSFLAASGADPSTVDQFNFALHFTLQNPVETPEPASLAVLGAGLAGLGALRRRKH